HLIAHSGIELDDLTPEGKKAAEDRLHRSIEDLPYTLLVQEARAGSVIALNVEVARVVYDAEQSRMLEDLRKEVVLPGYRKGKAPLKLLQIRLGEEAKRDTVRSIATNALRQENVKQSFKFVTRPQVIDFTLPDDGGPLRLEAELEIEPTVEVKHYKGFTVEVESRPVTDEMVNARIENLRRQNAILETADEGAMVNPGDTIVATIEVTNEQGERLEHLCHEKQTIHAFARELPGPVADQIIGRKAGERVVATVENKTTNRRGEEVVHKDLYTVAIDEIKIQKLPALDDEFAKDLGEYETLEALRDGIRNEMVKEQEERERSQALDRIYAQLIKSNPVEAPRSMLARQQYDLIMEDSYQLARMGLKLENVVQDTSEYLRSQQVSAGEQVKLRLLLDAIATQEKLEVTDEDVDKEIEAVAERSGRKPLAVRARLEAQNQLDACRRNLAARKQGDFLLAQSTVVKVAPKPPETKASAPEASAEPEKTE
ncbi:MAG: trigger factor, partial [bacterium]|nr:trigger factor [bacterium]